MGVHQSERLGGINIHKDADGKSKGMLELPIRAMIDSNMKWALNRFWSVWLSHRDRDRDRRRRSLLDGRRDARS